MAEGGGSDEPIKPPVSAGELVEAIQKLGWTGAGIVVLMVTASAVTVILAWRLPDIITAISEHKARVRDIERGTEQGKLELARRAQQGATGNKEGDRQ